MVHYTWGGSKYEQKLVPNVSRENALVETNLISQDWHLAWSDDSPAGVDHGQDPHLISTPSRVHKKCPVVPRSCYQLLLYLG